MDDLATMIAAEIPALRRYARALLRDAERADDLVQDCLLRAWSRRHLWRQPGNLRAWLFTILHNLYANQMRSLSRQPRFAPSEAAEHMGQNARQGDQLETSEVLDAMDNLNDDQREAILLVGVEGLRYEEAAAVLGVPVGTVMSRLSRGRERLRELTDRGNVPPIRRVK